MLPLVSVIIPTYNRRLMVREAVESVLAQSYQSFEIIVVDDGSTDGTANELAKSGKPVRLLRRPRGGVAGARNRGVRIARGHYVAFLDSDDLWLPKKLEIQAAFLKQHPEIQICQTEEVWIRRGVRVNPRTKHRKPSGDIFQPSLELCLVSPSAAMLTKALFDQFGGFDESFPVCEDYDLWLRIAVSHAVALIPAELVIKRGGHSDQLSHALWGMDRYRVEALRKLLQTGLSGERRKWVIEVLRRKVGILARGARKRGKEREALAYEAVVLEFIQEGVDVGGKDSRTCKAQRLSCENVGALADLGSAG